MQRPDERELREQLARLRAEHRDLDDQIVAEEVSSHADQLLIKRLKKRKLALKDQITASRISSCRTSSPRVVHSADIDRALRRLASRRCSISSLSAGFLGNERIERMAGQAKIGIIMGSLSDWPTMKCAADVLDELGVAYEAKVVSAHRTPKRLYEYAETAKARGPEGDHRRRRRGRASARHDRGHDAAPGARRAHHAARRCPARTACCRSCRCRRACRSARWPSARPGATNAGLLAAQILALADERPRQAAGGAPGQAVGVRSRGTEGRCLRTSSPRPASRLDHRHPRQRPARTHAGDGRRTPRPHDARLLRRQRPGLRRGDPHHQGRLRRFRRTLRSSRQASTR